MKNLIEKVLSVLGVKDRGGKIMNNLLVDQRDQKFVLHEMLNVGELYETSLYGHLSKEDIDSSLEAALKLAVKESYPIMGEADREGCRLENGNVKVPQSFHQLKKHFDQGKWASSYLSPEIGGLGFPLSVWEAQYENFAHNFAFSWCWAVPFSSTNIIAMAGSPEQKTKYLPKLISGKWGSAVSANDEGSGSDVLMQTAVAVKQPDGSYLIKGNKSHVTAGDSDLFENIIHVVIARVEGDPYTGLSTFIVPKYLVNKDGSLGRRNDYTVIGLERKMGIKASPTCSVNFGENGSCYGELIGERAQAVPAVMNLLKLGYGSNSTVATGIASAAYLHALDFAQKRVQGAHISEAQNPDAKPVPIINHPDVRRMLLWMKSHVEGMRALVSYSWLCMDKAMSLADPAERDKYAGLMDILLPISRLFSTDRGFKVTETAIQVHGRTGYFSDHPVQQFLRDIKVTTLWEVCSGVHALLYIAQTMGQRDGKDFVNLLTEMNKTIGEYGSLEGIQDLAEDLLNRVNLLGGMGMYFGNCGKEGKVIIPISNATPFAYMMGDICVGWLLFWQAGIAAKRLAAIFQENHIDPLDLAKKGEFLSKNKEAAFYDGKLLSARFFIKNVLPEVDAVAAAIKNEDLSLMAIDNSSF